MDLPSDPQDATRFDEAPAHFNRFDDRYEPLVDLSGKGIVCYGPGYRPLCGEESLRTEYTDYPAQVNGCDECLENELSGLGATAKQQMKEIATTNTDLGI